MKRLSTLLGAVLALTTTAAACNSGESRRPEGSGAGGTGGSTAQPGPQANWTVDELTRITTGLAIERFPGTQGSDQARQFIISEYQRCGLVGLDALAGSFEQPVTTGDGVNVLGVIPGSDPELASRTIFISAHYDTHQDTVVGANDNAAGVATIITVGCAFAQNPVPKTIVIAAWDTEEPPFFFDERMGSRFYTNNALVPLTQIDAVLNLDPIGADTWEGFARHMVSGAELSPQLRAAVDQAAIPAGLEPRRLGLHMTEEQPTGHLSWSDHGNFRDLGVPVLWFANGLNKTYHEPTDTIETLNFENMSKQAAYLYDIAKNLGESAEVPIYDPAGTDYLEDATVTVEALQAAIAPGGLIDQIQYSSTSRSKLEADLADAQMILDDLKAGGVPGQAAIRRLRDGIQHIMCYSGTDYPEGLCNQF